jgi:1-deoxy-D-xylulose-5-phosphate reductoisomerase
VEHLSRTSGEDYRIVALAGGTQVTKLAEQARRYAASAVCVANPKDLDELRRQLEPSSAQLLAGPAGLIEIATREDVDIVVAAIVGTAGLAAVRAAVRAGKTIALANKEALVVAGSVLIPEAKASGATILPVDSEHSAIFQALLCGRLGEVKRAILTASGGPFRTTPLSRMEQASVADALAHPTWRMGSKVTIDSATMFNKALEIIEACWLFDLPPRQIEVAIHPESIIHSMVEFVDGNVIAQLSPPDMRTPIQYALTYPKRHTGIAPRLDLARQFCLNFEPPDEQRFGALRLAYQAAERRGTAGAVLNAANEAAVAAFLAGRIPFGMICRVVENTIASQPHVASPTFEGLMAADASARAAAGALIDRIAGAAELGVQGAGVSVNVATPPTAKGSMAQAAQ